MLEGTFDISQNEQWLFNKVQLLIILGDALTI